MEERKRQVFEACALVAGMSLYWPLLRHNHFGLITRSAPTWAFVVLALGVILLAVGLMVRETPIARRLAEHP